MSKYKKRVKSKKYDQNFLRWLKSMKKRIKVTLFFLVFTLLILGLGFFLNRLISHY